MQYIYNNTENEKMKILLFFVNYEYNLIIKKLYSEELLVLLAAENAKKLRSLHEQLKENTEFINHIVEQYYNKKYKDVLSWKKEDKVYLQRKNI